jgi:conjugal transfer pilus assembly protein TraW
VSCNFLPIAALTVLLIAVSSARAAVIHDLGIVGETYPVQEPDIIAELKQKAARAQDPALFERMKTYQPPELHHLPPAKADRTFLVDMTYTLDRDIADSDGRVIYPRGYTFNPLDYISFPGGLVVINAEDPSQVSWFTSSPYFENHQARLLISGGLAADLVETLQRPVYYLTEDIAGRLQLAAVPSVVIQHEDRLQVREFYLAPEAQEKEDEGK